MCLRIVFIEFFQPGRQLIAGGSQFFDALSITVECFLIPRGEPIQRIIYVFHLLIKFGRTDLHLRSNAAVICKGVPEYFLNDKQEIDVFLELGGERLPALNGYMHWFLYHDGRNMM